MRGHYSQMKWAATNQLSGRGIVVWIRSFIEQQKRAPYFPQILRKVTPC